MNKSGEVKMEYWSLMTIVIIATLGALTDGANLLDESVCPKKCVLCEKNDTSWEILGAVCEDVTVGELAGPVKHAHIYDGAPDKIPNGILKDFLFFGIEDLTYLKIQNYGLTRIWGSPLINNSHLEVLDLAENKIFDITAQSFLGPTGLRVLILSKNNISQIPNNTFSGLQSLTNLNLSYNHLESISSMLFEGLPNLIDLDLSHNEIDSLDKEVMKNIKTIKRLKLGYNQWRTVPSHLFTDLIHLNFLSLEGNNLSTLSEKDFPGKSVTILNIANNNFTEVPTQALEQLSKYDLVFNISGNHIEKLNDLGNITVDTLDLSGNHMTDIDPGVFEHSTIATLDLHNNNLTTLPKLMELYFRLMGTRQILLHENPWHCDCNLQWLADFLYFHYSRVDPVCKTPPKYQGKMIQKLRRELQKDCLLTTTTIGVATLPLLSTAGTTKPTNTLTVSTLKPTASTNPSSSSTSTLSATPSFTFRTSQKSTFSFENTTPAGIPSVSTPHITTDSVHSNTTATSTTLPNTTGETTWNNSSTSEMYPSAKSTTPNTLLSFTSVPLSSTTENVDRNNSLPSSFSTGNPTTVAPTNSALTTEDQVLGSTEKEAVTSESSSLANKGETSTSEYFTRSSETSKLPGNSLSTSNSLFTDFASGKTTDVGTHEVSSSENSDHSSETHIDATTESFLKGNFTTSNYLALETSNSSPMSEVSTIEGGMTTSKQTNEITTESFLTYSKSETTEQHLSTENTVASSMYGRQSTTLLENTSTTDEYQTPTNQAQTVSSSQTATEETNLMSTSLTSFQTTTNPELNYSGTTTENPAYSNLTQMFTGSTHIYSASQEMTSESPKTLETSTMSKSSTESSSPSETTSNFMSTSHSIVDASSETITTNSPSYLTSNTESTANGITSVPNPTKFTTGSATLTEESTTIQTSKELETSSYNTETTTNGIPLTNANTSSENSTKENTTSNGALWLNMTTVGNHPIGTSDVTNTTPAVNFTDDQVNATTPNTTGTIPTTDKSSSLTGDLVSSSIPVTLNPTGGVALNFSTLDINLTTSGYNTFPVTPGSKATTIVVPNSTVESSLASTNLLSSNISTEFVTTTQTTNETAMTTSETTKNWSRQTTDSFHHTVEKSTAMMTDRTTTQIAETTTPTSTAKVSTNQMLSSQSQMTTASINTGTGSGVTPTSSPTSPPSTNIITITTDNSTSVVAAQNAASENAGISIATIVVPIVALLILSCLGFLIFAGIKRSLVSKITDKLICSSEEGFFMPIKQFDQAKPLFNRKIKSDYSVYVTENGNCA